jgi:dolichol-phosphate mannosyltransferase
MQGQARGRASFATENSVAAPPAADAAGEAQLSVVIPVHNEADCIGPLIGEIHAALEDRVNYEIVVVDDGSNDATWANVAAARSSNGRVRGLRHAQNCGQSAALLTGVLAARAPWIATLDGDAQNDPADIPGLWEHLQRADRGRGLKLVAGHRQQRRDSWIRRLSSRIANGVRARALGDRTPDTGCGLKLIERETYLALPRFDHMHRFLPALVLRAGGVVESVPVNHRPRLSGRTHYGIGNRLWVGLVDMLGVMWLQRRARWPLHVDELPPEN